MSIAQNAINALRDGDFNQILTLPEEIINKYSPICMDAEGIIIAEGELQQLLAYELALTDINEDDLKKLHLLERLIKYGHIYSHLSDEGHAHLNSTIVAFCTANSIKKVDKHKDYIPDEVTKESIKGFLGEKSQFSQLISNEDCNASIVKLQNFIVNNSDEVSIQTLVNELNQDEKNASFMRSLRHEQQETNKVGQLKSICSQYIEHLTNIIEKHIKENDTNLHKSIFKDEIIENVFDADNPGDRRTITIEGGIHRLDEVCELGRYGDTKYNQLKTLMNSDSNFKLAVDKYRAVSDMLNKLEDKSQLSQSPLESFKTTFNDNKKLLRTRRDSAGMTFLKGVATVLSLGSILLVKNFWKPEGKKKSQNIESALTAKL